MCTQPQEAIHPALRSFSYAMGTFNEEASDLIRKWAMVGSLKPRVVDLTAPRIEHSVSCYIWLRTLADLLHSKGVNCESIGLLSLIQSSMKRTHYADNTKI